MGNDPQTDKQVGHYDQWYAKGGWRYFDWRERRFLKRRIVEPLRLEPGSRLLEIGCGRGIHANALAKLGLDVTGVDISPVGIEAAAAAYTRPRFLAIDAAKLRDEFGPEQFDVIYARGMSWYHYELTGVNEKGVDVPARTRELFELLKPGGLFVLQIITDFSGGKANSGVHYNTLGNYIALFEPLGKIVRLTNWKGVPLTSDAQARELKNHVIIATQKPAS